MYVCHESSCDFLNSKTICETLGRADIRIKLKKQFTDTRHYFIQVPNILQECVRC
jgi:hypothetical protein